MLSQAEARVLPTGEVMPIPVTTTRRWLMAGLRSRGHAAPGWLPRRPAADGYAPARSPASQMRRAAHARPCCAHVRRSGLDVRLDVVDRLLHGGDLFRFL